MNDEVLESALRDEEQTRQRILRLETEIAQARAHIDEIGVFKRLLVTYDGGSLSAGEEAISPSSEVPALADDSVNDPADPDETVGRMDRLFSRDTGFASA